MSAKLKIHKDSSEYIRDLNYDGNELYEKYQNMWVAIVNNKVVACGKNLIQVKKEASKKTDKKEDEIPVKYIENIGAIF